MSVNGTESTPNIYLPCRLSQLTQVLLIYLPVQSQCHIWLGWNNIAPLCSSVCITRVARCIVYRAPFLLPTIARGSRFHAAPKNVFFSNGPPPQKTLAAAPRRGHAHRDEAAGGRAAGRRTPRTDGRARPSPSRRLSPSSLFPRRSASTPPPPPPDSLAPAPTLSTASGGGVFRSEVAPVSLPGCLPARSDITTGSGVISGGGWLAGWQAAGGEYFFPLRIHNPERERVSSRTKFRPVAASIIDPRSSDNEIDS